MKWELKNIRKCYLCDWCIEACRDHGAEIYSGKYVLDGKEFCEDCGEAEDIRECVLIGVN